MYLYDFATFGFLDEGLVVEHVGGGGDCSALSNPTWRVCLFRSFLYTLEQRQRKEKVDSAGFFCFLVLSA